MENGEALCEYRGQNEKQNGKIYRSKDQNRPQIRGSHLWRGQSSGKEELSADSTVRTVAARLRNMACSSREAEGQTHIRRSNASSATSWERLPAPRASQVRCFSSCSKAVSTTWLIVLASLRASGSAPDSAHKNITVNGKVVNIPSYRVKPSDVVAARKIQVASKC